MLSWVVAICFYFAQFCLLGKLLYRLIAAQHTHIPCVEQLSILATVLYARICTYIPQQ